MVNKKPKPPRVRVHFSHEARKPCPCPVCGRLAELATNVEQDDASGPVPGSFVFCFTCGHPAQFTAEFTLRELSTSEIANAWKQPVFWNAWVSMQGKRRKYRTAQGVKPE